MSEMICTSCQKPKYQLKAVMSKLLPTQKIFLCTDCYAQGFEPRHFVILAAQINPQRTAEYVRDHKYVGNPIHLHEIMK